MLLLLPQPVALVCVDEPAAADLMQGPLTNGGRDPAVCPPVVYEVGSRTDVIVEGQGCG
ncbi:hypothetical protein D3C73_1284640 [compost metagenome]